MDRKPERLMIDETASEQGLNIELLKAEKDKLK